MEELDPELIRAILAATPERLSDPRGFDAIVVGGGAAGGLASLLLTEAGMNVLLLDAGWRPSFWQAPLRQTTAAIVKCMTDPRLNAVLPPRATALGRKALWAWRKFYQPVQMKCIDWNMPPDAFVDDRENPYLNEAGSHFDWFRVRQIGGRMTIPGHGRQYYRLSERDLRPEDGLSPDWPIEPRELSTWYDIVEERLGLVTGGEDCHWVPAGPPVNIRQATPAEAETIGALKSRWPSAHAILGRFAPPLKTVEMAAATGRLICRQGAVVANVDIGPDGKARGVNWQDRATGAEMSARAPIVFLCASALETTRILLQTRTASGEVVGAQSSTLGLGLMDHVLVRAHGVGGALAEETEPYVPGRCIYLSRFDLRDGPHPGSRGYGIQVYRGSLGAGRSFFDGYAFGEMTPRAENRVVLDPNRRDAWGLPVLRIACTHSEPERQLATDQSMALREIGACLGIDFHQLETKPAVPGTAFHECGTACMGDDAGNSVLDPYNQCWDVKGLYVTDASAFPSQGVQNPTLTILAITARACANVSASVMSTPHGGASRDWHG